jgi:formyltetrahydrofolate deformylase
MSITFLIQCPDAKGLLAGTTSFFYSEGFNILHCQQHTDLLESVYYMRIKLDIRDLKCSRKELESKFAAFGAERGFKWSVHYSDIVPKVAVFVSKAPHCLYDLLLRQAEGEIKCDIPLIIGNHPDLEHVADKFKIPFYCFPFTQETQAKCEKEMLCALKKHHIDLVVLARYMRVLSGGFLGACDGRVINIHHGFLPAFQGANPYLQAYNKGVKMIGATAHYATAELDAGPIIEQDVERVSHELSPDELKLTGRDIECKVLSKAVKYHLENRIIISGNRTIVFASGI